MCEQIGLTEQNINMSHRVRVFILIVEGKKSLQTLAHLAALPVPSISSHVPSDLMKRPVLQLVLSISDICFDTHSGIQKTGSLLCAQVSGKRETPFTTRTHQSCQKFALRCTKRDKSFEKQTIWFSYVKSVIRNKLL